MALLTSAVHAGQALRHEQIGKTTTAWAEFIEVRSPSGQAAKTVGPAVGRLSKCACNGHLRRFDRALGRASHKANSAQLFFRLGQRSGQEISEFASWPREPGVFLAWARAGAGGVTASKVAEVGSADPRSVFRAKDSRMRLIKGTPTSPSKSRRAHPGARGPFVS